MAELNDIGLTVVQPGGWARSASAPTDSEVVLGPGGYITGPRGQMHAVWNAGSGPGRIIEIITPGGFENYFRELGELLLEHADDPAGRPLHELPESDEYGLTYGSPEWMDDIAQRYGLNPPSH